MTTHNAIHDSFSQAFSRLIDETYLTPVHEFESLPPESIGSDSGHPQPNAKEHEADTARIAWEEDLAPDTDEPGIDCEEPLIRIDSFARWSEPIRYLTSAWQPVMASLVYGRISEPEAASQMQSLLNDWLTDQPGIPIGRASSFSLSIPRILALHRSMVHRAAEGECSTVDLLKRMREERRRNALRPSGQNAGIYVSFANMVHDAHIEYHARLLRDASA